MWNALLSRQNALFCESRKRYSFLQFGIVAQLEERLLHTQEVIGSRPVGPMNYKTDMLESKRPGIKTGRF